MLMGADGARNSDGMPGARLQVLEQKAADAAAAPWFHAMGFKRPHLTCEEAPGAWFPRSRAPSTTTL